MKFKETFPVSFDFQFFVSNKTGETKRKQTMMINENVYSMYKFLKLSAVPCDYKMFHLHF